MALSSPVAEASYCANRRHSRWTKRAALDAGFGPRQVALGRAVGQHEPANRVGAVLADDLIGIDDVLLRLRHLDDAADLDRRAIRLQRRALARPFDFGRGEPHRLAAGVGPRIGLVRHHALREQAGEGLLHVQLADPGQRARPEAGVEQVQDRVLDPADILFHRHPLADLFGIERAVGRLAGEAQEVPRRIDEGIERVGLAPGGLAALRAIDMLPGGVADQRVARRLEIDVLGQRHGSCFLGTGTTPQTRNG
jgi:hypothetical protein